MSELDFLDGITPGIYHTEILRNIHDQNQAASFALEQTKELSHLRDREGEIPKFYATLQEFLQRWINGRAETGLPLYLNQGKGFELQKPIVREWDNSKAYSIEGLVIASDFGYTGDFGDTMVVGINDTRSEKVFTYRDQFCKGVKARPRGKKKMEARDIYRFTKNSEKYPFGSLNPLKSADSTWSLINIHENEVYAALRDVGFKW